MDSVRFELTTFAFLIYWLKYKNERLNRAVVTVLGVPFGVVVLPGIEPGLQESKSCVLPLDYKTWCREWDSNPRGFLHLVLSETDWPLSYPCCMCCIIFWFFWCYFWFLVFCPCGRVRRLGIEPRSTAWKAIILPLNYRRLMQGVGFEPTRIFSNGS